MSLLRKSDQQSPCFVSEQITPSTPPSRSSGIRGWLHPMSQVSSWALSFSLIESVGAAFQSYFFPGAEGPDAEVLLLAAG